MNVTILLIVIIEHEKKNEKKITLNKNLLLKMDASSIEWKKVKKKIFDIPIVSTWMDCHVPFSYSFLFLVPSEKENEKKRHIVFIKSMTIKATIFFLLFSSARCASVQMKWSDFAWIFNYKSLFIA